MDHDEFVNKILENAPNLIKDDESLEVIAIQYVRDLEALRDAIMRVITPVITYQTGIPFIT